MDNKKGEKKRAGKALTLKKKVVGLSGDSGQEKLTTQGEKWRTMKRRNARIVITGRGLVCVVIRKTTGSGFL